MRRVGSSAARSAISLPVFPEPDPGRHRSSSAPTSIRWAPTSGSHRGATATPHPEPTPAAWARVGGAPAARPAVTLDGTTHRGHVACAVNRDYDRLFVPEEAPIVQLVRRAARTLGREITRRRSGGGP